MFVFIVRYFFIFVVDINWLFWIDWTGGEEGGEKEKEMQVEEGREAINVGVEEGSACSIRCSAMLFVPIRLSVIKNK